MQRCIRSLQIDDQDGADFTVRHEKVRSIGTQPTGLVQPSLEQVAGRCSANPGRSEIIIKILTLPQASSWDDYLFAQT